MELEELQQHIEEDQQIDHEYQRLQSQAREAQQLQDEAIRTQESLTRQLERRRQLKKRANELEIAKMVTSLLRERTQDPGGARSSPCPSDHRGASNLAAPPPVTMAPSSANQPAAPHPVAPAPANVAPALAPPPVAAAPPPVSVALPPAQYPFLPPPLQSALPHKSTPSSLAPVNYNSAPTPDSAHSAQYHPSSYAYTYPVQTASRFASALPQSSPQQPQIADAVPFIATSYGIPSF